MPEHLLDSLPWLFLLLTLLGLKPYKTPSRYATSTPRHFFAENIYFPAVSLWFIFLCAQIMGLVYFVGLSAAVIEDKYDKVSTLVFMLILIIANSVFIQFYTFLSSSRMYQMLVEFAREPVEGLRSKMGAVLTPLLMFWGLLTVFHVLLVIAGTVLVVCYGCGLQCSDLPAVLGISFLASEFVCAPLILLASIAFFAFSNFLVILFDEFGFEFSSCSRNMREFHSTWRKYCHLTKLVKVLDDYFALYVFGTSCFTLIGCCFCLYYFFSPRSEVIQFSLGDKFRHYSLVQHTRLIIDFIMAFGSFLLHCVAAIRLNERSRRVRTKLYALDLNETSANQLMYKFLMKTEDRNWGMTMGHFFIIERQALLTVSFLSVLRANIHT